MKLTICLVAYSTKFDETLSFRALLGMTEKIRQQLHVRVFDNGQTNYNSVKFDRNFASFDYEFNQKNERGTRIAYQSALEQTQDEWLLLLDDDTELTENYLQTILDRLQSQTDPNLVAYCPLIFDKDVQISPTASDTIAMLNFPKTSGLYQENITGIASCLVLSTKFLQQIGGFNMEFPLDYLDHWLFHEITAQHKKVAVLDLKIAHHLSVQALPEISDERFAAIFSSEYRYYQSYNANLLRQIRRKYGKMIIRGFVSKKSGIRSLILLKLLCKGRL